MQDFRDLKVWQRAHQLVLEIYQATANFPEAEKYGLTCQLRRSAASVPANIAEGCDRGSQPDLLRFLHMAMGSASELEYHLLLARDLALLDDAEYGRHDNGVSSIKRMLSALMAKVRQAINEQRETKR